MEKGRDFSPLLCILARVSHEQEKNGIKILNVEKFLAGLFL